MSKKLSRPRDRAHDPASDRFTRQLSDVLDDLRRSARRGDLDLAVVRRGRHGYRVVAVVPRRRMRRAS